MTQRERFLELPKKTLDEYLPNKLSLITEFLKQIACLSVV